MPRLFLLFPILFLCGTVLAGNSAGLMKLVKGKDADIYAVDASPSGRFMVAVGEDTSERTQKLQMMDEYHESVILVSTDAGQSWARSSASGDETPLDSVIVLDEKRAVVSGAIEGAGGMILRTTNRGKSWKRVYEGVMLHDLARNGEKSIWAAGYGLLHSSNGGRSWRESGAPETFYYAIHAVDDRTLVAAGDTRIVRTTNAGKSWQVVPLPENTGGFHKIEVRDGRLVMTSWDEKVLVSDDGGASWRKK